jgi:pimeloyl-ACP methyl ester carboxylesterase
MLKRIVRLLLVTLSSTTLIKAFALPLTTPPMDTMTAPARELTLQCSDGMVIAAQQWYAKANPLEDREGETRTRNILCLHGWLDNCRSFSRLGPELAERLARTDTDGIQVTNTDVNLVAIDFLGHGLSSHKSLDGPSILLSESAFYVSEVIEKLGWWKEDKSNKRKKLADGTAAATTTSPSNNVPFTLIGHSMGASVACVMAAAFPERIASLILLDGAGPLDRPAASIAKHVRNHIERRQAGNAKLVMESRVIYPSVDVAVRLRRKTATNFPGNQYLSGEAAKEMILRGSEIDNEGRVKFLHDPRLRWPSAHYFTAEQTEALYRDIQCPTCLLRAQDGWPVEEGKGERLMQILKPKVMKILPGSHHFHADPRTYNAVAEEIIKFLQE